MTYSICALDAATGELGVGVQTHRPAVGAIVPWVAPGAGAVATQASANINLGPRALALLRRGLGAEASLTAVLASDPKREVRQLGVVDGEGRAAAHTGSNTIPHAGHLTGDGYSVQANMMLNETVPRAMADAFEGSSGRLATRILAALDAAEAEGGDMRGMWSAAILVRPADRAHVDPTWDLRVDDDPAPLAKLRRLVNLRLAGELERQLAATARGAAEPSGEGQRAPGREAALAALEQIQALDATDETLFWFCLALANRSRELELAVELLTPLIDRAPHWRTLLHRLREPEYNAELAARFPLPA